MRFPARAFCVLALVVAASAAAAGERFRPVDPKFVVADVRHTVPDAQLARLLEDWRRRPADPQASVALANGLLEKAQTTHQAMFVGRAEAVLEIALRGPATAEQRRLYARTLQFRHDFSAARRLLDGLLLENPRDAAARTQRASIALVQGEFAIARSDCAQLMTFGGLDSSIGLACFAAALAGGGQLESALAFLDKSANEVHQPQAFAYALIVRADLRERSGLIAAAIADYRTALLLTPDDEALRASLADALTARNDVVAAREVLGVDKPGLGVLVRRSLLEQGPERAAWLSRASARLALETARGDAPHWRESALLAEGLGDRRRAVIEAQRNFSQQKELVDVRLLARCALAARDQHAAEQLRSWLRTTGFKDRTTAGILSRVSRG